MCVLPIPLGNCHSIEKCFPINLCHQYRQGLKIELCFIELRWSLAQLKQLRVLIHQSILCTIRGQTFADCCLYLFQALFGEIAIWLSSLYGQLGFTLGLHTRKDLIKKEDCQSNHNTVSLLTVLSIVKPIYWQSTLHTLKVMCWEDTQITKIDFKWMHKHIKNAPDELSVHGEQHPYTTPLKLLSLIV